MSSNRIEELKKRRQVELKNKKNQIHYALAITLITFAIYIFLLKHNIEYSKFWIIGLLIGFTLQRSRFCFGASFRDPVLAGSTSILRAIIIAFIITTIGFSILQSNYSLDHVNTIPGQIYPVGIHTVIGAILFGLGMVIAGGCGSGILMRIGEGFTLQIVVLIGFIIGAMSAARNFEFWDKLIISKSPTIYLARYLGFPMTTILQIIVLIILYILVSIYDKKNNMMRM
ncbi:YeeE/YedE thiosulfate transporter family protein [Alkalithermobacter paradoxus]|uniref:Putative inner membrane protein n=1 Tax=Alkalithermobacter paradoxus TaxID=29349 RepID=A0A1V4ICN7_9FIRM|nr:putative inner membrane protein [[Clostridium] thermoalcaliphilum]